MGERFMPTVRVQRILLAFGILVAAAVPGTADPEVRLVSHVEPRNGSVPAVVGPNEPINPASVVKVATSLWALAELGPDHRFETRFGIRGTLDPQSGYLDGDLIVIGGGDPDFHIENAYLVMRYLNRMGVREVGGSLRVTDEFWISAGRAARRSARRTHSNARCPWRAACATPSTPRAGRRQRRKG